MFDTDDGCWWLPFSKHGTASVFQVDAGRNPEHEESAFSWLNASEKIRWHRFIHKGARRRFALCRAALRALLCIRLDCENRRLTFGASLYDKPFAIIDKTPAPISFNVSHSGNHGLIAIAPAGRLGIDVEVRTERRDFDRLIDTAFGVNEQAALNQARGKYKTRLFYKLWTIKESLIKALGTGMSYDPADFESPPNMLQGDGTGTYEFPRIPMIRWLVTDLSNENFAAALAQEMDPGKNPISEQDIQRLVHN